MSSLKKILLLVFLLAMTPAMSVKADGGLVPTYGRNIMETGQTGIIVFDGQREELHLLASYYGDTREFAWVIPTPGKPTVEKSNLDYFDDLYNVSHDYEYYWNNRLSSGAIKNDINVVSREMVGHYDVAVLAATNAESILTWLNKNGYSVNQEAREVFEYYIEEGWYFTAVRIDSQKAFAEAVKAFSEFNNTVTEDNFVEKVAAFTIWTMDKGDYVMYQKIDNVIERFGSELAGLTEEEFKAVIDRRDVGELSEEDRYYFEMGMLVEYAREISAINGRHIFDYCVNRYKKFNSSVTVENFATVLADDLVVAALNRDYEKFKAGFETMSIFTGDAGELNIVASEKNFLAEMDSTEEMFDEMSEDTFKRFLTMVLYESARELDPEYFNAERLAKLALYYPNVEIGDYAKLITGGIIESIRNNDFNKFNQSLGILSDLALGDDFFSFSFFMSIEEIFNMVIEESKDFTEEEWNEIATEGEELFGEIIESLLSVKYAGEIDPIKIGFDTDEMVYPLKISQFSSFENGNEENEQTIALYVVADYPVKAEGFQKEYGDWLNGDDYADSYNSSLIEIIRGKKYVTRLQGSFGKAEMDNDIFITIDDNASVVAESETNDALNLYEDTFFLPVPTNDPVAGPLEVVPVALIDKSLINADNSVGRLAIDAKMQARLKGRIIIRTQANGEAYYIDMKEPIAHYLGRPADAYAILRNVGIGITNKDLKKVPLAYFNVGGKDSDGDGLADKYEEAIGTNIFDVDSDDDGYDDRSEIFNGYDPLVKNKKMMADSNFVEKNKGKIFIQVEGAGEAWYVNPADGLRYYLGSPEDAFSVMRSINLGISEADFLKLNIN